MSGTACFARVAADIFAPPESPAVQGALPNTPFSNQSAIANVRESCEGARRLAEHTPFSNGLSAFVRRICSANAIECSRSRTEQESIQETGAPTPRLRRRHLEWTSGETEK